MTKNRNKKKKKKKVLLLLSLIVLLNALMRPESFWLNSSKDSFSYDCLSAPLCILSYICRKALAGSSYISYFVSSGAGRTISQARRLDNSGHDGAILSTVTMTMN